MHSELEENQEIYQSSLLYLNNVWATKQTYRHKDLRSQALTVTMACKIMRVSAARGETISA